MAQAEQPKEETLTTTSRPPRDLGPEGRALWRSIDAWRREQHLVLDPHEEPMVAELCRTADRLATIRGALPAIDVADPAWSRLASEERQQRLAYGRQVSALGFPSGVVGPSMVTKPAPGTTPRSRRAQKAAQSRWGVSGA